jgi:hypothetical protein
VLAKAPLNEPTAVRVAPTMTMLGIFPVLIS